MNPRKNIARKRKLARRIVERERVNQLSQAGGPIRLYVVTRDGLTYGNPPDRIKCRCKAHARRHCRWCRGTGTILCE